VAEGPRIDAQNPWPWLEPFTEIASGFFHGRDDDVQALLRSVLTTPVCVLFGKSGLGKTSLLLAGLFPLLRARALLPVSLRRFEHAEGGAGLSAQLRRVLNDAVVSAKLHWTRPPADEAAGGDEVAALWELLHDRSRQLLDDQGRRWAPVFALDQFEEVFTLQLDEARRLQTFQELGDLLENRVPPAVAARLDVQEDLVDSIDFDSQPYRFLVSLREDFLPELEPWADLIPRLGPNRYRLLPMSREQAWEAVQKTGGALVDADSAPRIVEFLARASAQAGSVRAVREQRRIEPALLSLVCASLNADRLTRQPPGAKLDVTDLETRGSQILDRFYDGAFAELPNDVRSQAERWVEANLITEGGARRPYPLAAVDATLLPALRALVNRRLMRIENTEQGDQVELVHDRLAAVARQRAQATQQRADEAQRLRREKDAAEVELLKQRARTAEIAEERARLEQARADDAMRASRRAARLTIALSGVLVLALAAAILAWISTRNLKLEVERLNDSRQKLDAFAAADTAAAKQAADAYQKALDAAAKAKEAAEMALKKTGAGQQQAAELLSDANRSYRSAALDTEKLMRCPVGKRFYPHVGQDVDKAIVEGVMPALRASGFIVAPVQVVKAEAMPASTAVRYFHREDEAGATAAVSVMQSAGLPGVKTAFLPGYENSATIRPCHYELWLAVGAGKR
jgi:hypothetical protein